MHAFFMVGQKRDEHCPFRRVGQKSDGRTDKHEQKSDAHTYVMESCFIRLDIINIFKNKELIEVGNIIGHNLWGLGGRAQ